MTAPDPVLIETRLERRDGATWVSGICPFCWEREAFRAPLRGTSAVVQCINGHPIRIEGQTTAGEHARPT